MADQSSTRTLRGRRAVDYAGLNKGGALTQPKSQARAARKRKEAPSADLPLDGVGSGGIDGGGDAEADESEKKRYIYI